MKAGNDLPGQIMPGKRIYDLLPCYGPGIVSVMGVAINRLGKHANANMGKEDGEYIKENQAGISPELGDADVVLIFPDWPADNHGGITALRHLAGKWTHVSYENWDRESWNDNFRLVRRVR